MDRESLIHTLKKATANAYDVYFELYVEYFEKGDDPAEALKAILEYPFEIGDTKDENPQKITVKEENRIAHALEDLVCGAADRIAEMNCSKDEFYKKLYSAVFCTNNELFPQSREEKVIALKILSEKAMAVPYFQIDHVDEFSKEEFEETITKIDSQIQEALCLMRRYFDTAPEMVAQLLRISDAISGRREKILFWTVIINKFRGNDRD